MGPRSFLTRGYFMDAQKVVEVTELYLQQFGHYLTDDVRVEFRKIFTEYRLSATKKELLQLLAGCEKCITAGVVAQSFSKERRYPSKEDVVAHCAAMIPQIKQFIAEGRLPKCSRWSGFICAALVTSREQFLTYQLISFVAEEAKIAATKGRLSDAFCYLGYVQGALWATGAYSIQEFKNHNKPACAVLG